MRLTAARAAPACASTGRATARQRQSGTKASRPRPAPRAWPAHRRLHRRETGPAIAWCCKTPERRPFGVRRRNARNQRRLRRLENIECHEKKHQPKEQRIGNVDIGNMSLTAEQRGNALISQIHLANAKMDENNVPAEGRIFITTAMDW